MRDGVTHKRVQQTENGLLNSSLITGLMFRMISRLRYSYLSTTFSLGDYLLKPFSRQGTSI